MKYTLGIVAEWGVLSIGLAAIVYMLASSYAEMLQHFIRGLGL